MLQTLRSSRSARAGAGVRFDAGSPALLAALSLALFACGEAEPNRSGPGPTREREARARAPAASAQSSAPDRAPRGELELDAEPAGADPSPAAPAAGGWQLEASVSDTACTRDWARSESTQSLRIVFAPGTSSTTVEVIGLQGLAGLPPIEVAPQGPLEIGGRNAVASQVARSSTRYHRFALEADADGWNVAFEGTREFPLDDYDTVRCSFEGSGRARPDETPPVALFRGTPGPLSRVELSFDDAIEEASLSLHVQRLDGAVVPTDIVWPQAGRVLHVAPRSHWPEGELSLVLERAADRAGNLASQRFAFSAGEAARGAPTDFESDATASVPANCSRQATLELPAAAGSGPRTVAAPQGDRMLVCQTGCEGSPGYATRWAPAPGAAALSLRLAAFTRAAPADVSIRLRSPHAERVAAPRFGAVEGEFREILIDLTEEEQRLGFWLIMDGPTRCAPSFPGFVHTWLLLDRFELL